MAGILYRLGRWAAARRKWVLSGWILLLVVIGGLGLTLHGKLSTEFSVPGIESQNAQDLLTSEFPAAAGGTVRVVFQAKAGQDLTSAGTHTLISAVQTNAAAVGGVINVSDPYRTGAISADHRIGYLDVQFSQAASAVPQSAKDAVDSAMAPARASGLTVELGGTAEAPAGQVSGPGSIIGIVVAFLVLLVALGSVIAAGLPLVAALAGVVIGVLGVEFVSGFIDMTNTATVLAAMIGLAVGIDYALFIVSRHRENLGDPTQDVGDSIGRAVATAGSAVVFAGTTVIIALAALSAAGIAFLTTMGLAAAGTVLIAVLVALTLVPAVLGFAGEKLRPSGSKDKVSRVLAKQGRWGATWASWITRAPLPFLLVPVLGLLVLAWPAGHIRLGLPSNQTLPAASTQHRSYDLLTDGFGPGFNATLAVVVDTTGIPEGARASTIAALTAQLRADPDIALVAAPILNQTGRVAVVSVIPKTGPDEKATSDLVHRMREQDKQVIAGAGGVVYVAGNTAANIDVSSKLADALPLFLMIIVVLALLLLTLAFRSLLVPLKAVLGFLLSVAASLGAVVWVFQDGHLAGAFSVAASAPIVSFVPVLLIGVLFGLAMDYEVFLVSRMAESYRHTADPGGAVVTGVQRSGRVVAAAALIMASVFGGFVFTGDPIIKSIAFALTVGVLIDAFVIRLTVVPAVMVLLGRRAWRLPRWLDRALPNVDIEGASLPRRSAEPLSAPREVLVPMQATPGSGTHRNTYPATN